MSVNFRIPTSISPEAQAILKAVHERPAPHRFRLAQVLETLGWHWAFWINVPFGLMGLILGWFVLPQTRHLQSGGRFD